ncbi:MAG: redoxin domain-containing protein [Desulfobacterales bacterium]|uniref:Redoxin domain-containing protein n=1 Tax=Candidatus Desulfaltia bathyphila TaxID=2841697 RepID=A0A8J6N4P0_9BACT|nr:redoxin domain-containing protein [Candidatus Desulfaltia bathyphila]MBL7195085.1 redoxin domain-containing protein [Desulfobacterales bacterium]MBL7206990.1 redoxin domain-containing protein [Desulfobacterales bacterium]
MKNRSKRSINSLFIITIIALIMLPATHAKAGPIKIENMTSASFDQLINDQDNKYLIVFMTSWCAPCRKELPTLIKLHKKYRDRGLKTIGISLDLDCPKTMQPILSMLKLNFPFYCVKERVATKYKIVAVPMLFLVKHGEIVEKIIGERSEKYINKKINIFLE